MLTLPGLSPFCSYCLIVSLATSNLSIIHRPDKIQLAQELLSTFSTALGEVALQPSSGGTFIVEIYYSEPRAEDDKSLIQIQKHTLWDRKTDGGFPGM
jgi:predicted Rdx family selenoprotein